MSGRAEIPLGVAGGRCDGSRAEEQRSEAGEGPRAAVESPVQGGGSEGWARGSAPQGSFPGLPCRLSLDDLLSVQHRSSSWSRSLVNTFLLEFVLFLVENSFLA